MPKIRAKLDIFLKKRYLKIMEQVYLSMYHIKIKWKQSTRNILNTTILNLIRIPLKRVIYREMIQKLNTFTNKCLTIVGIKYYGLLFSPFSHPFSDHKTFNFLTFWTNTRNPRYICKIVSLTSGYYIKTSYITSLFFSH